MKKLIIILVFLININIYSNENPYFFLDKIITESKPVLKEKNNEYLEKIMEKYLDFNEISIWIMGRKLWFEISDTEKESFLKELKKLMLKTYSKTVYQYIDSNVEFIEKKSKNEKKFDKRIQISTLMKKNNKNVNITYRLIKKDNSWLIFDVVIEGISILKSLKNQYSDLIKTKGINHAIDKIKMVNEKF